MVHSHRPNALAIGTLVRWSNALVIWADRWRLSHMLRYSFQGKEMKGTTRGNQ